MIRCSEKGCKKTCPRSTKLGTPHEQGFRWTWKTGWRCSEHPPYTQGEARGGA